MSKTIEELRRQIDTTDKRILDLLEERAEYVSRIGEAKKKKNLPVILPEREINLIRKLLESHDGRFPKESIVRIWREIIGAVISLQKSIKVAVTVNEDRNGIALWDLAKDYLSSSTELHRSGSALSSFAMVREGEAEMAIMPWPLDDEENAWWTHLMNESGENAVRIVGRLPLYDRGDEDIAPEHRAVVIGRLEYRDSGSDRSFLALELDSAISRAKLVDEAGKLGWTVLSVHHCDARDSQTRYYLLEIKGYENPAESKGVSLLKALGNENGRCEVIGGYPVPPVLAPD